MINANTGSLLQAEYGLKANVDINSLYALVNVGSETRIDSLQITDLQDYIDWLASNPDTTQPKMITVKTKVHPWISFEISSNEIFISKEFAKTYKAMKDLLHEHQVNNTKEFELPSELTWSDVLKSFMKYAIANASLSDAIDNGVETTLRPRFDALTKTYIFDETPNEVEVNDNVYVATLTGAVPLSVIETAINELKQDPHYAESHINPQTMYIKLVFTI